MPFILDFLVVIGFVANVVARLDLSACCLTWVTFLCFPEFSELPSSLSLPSAQREGGSKRSGSPPLLEVDNKNAKRIRCISSENDSNINRRSNSECAALNSIEVGIIFFHIPQCRFTDFLST